MGSAAGAGDGGTDAKSGAGDFALWALPFGSTAVWAIVGSAGPFSGGGDDGGTERRDMVVGGGEREGAVWAAIDGRVGGRVMAAGGGGGFVGQRAGV